MIWRKTKHPDLHNLLSNPTVEILQDHNGNYRLLAYSKLTLLVSSTKWAAFANYTTLFGTAGLPKTSEEFNFKIESLSK